MNWPLNPIPYVDREITASAIFTASGHVPEAADLIEVRLVETTLLVRTSWGDYGFVNRHDLALPVNP